MKQFCRLLSKLKLKTMYLPCSRCFHIFLRKMFFKFKVLQETCKILATFHIQKASRKKSQLELYLLIKISLTVGSIGFQLVVASKNTQINFPLFNKLQDYCMFLNPDQKIFH